MSTAGIQLPGYVDLDRQTRPHVGRREPPTQDVYATDNVDLTEASQVSDARSAAPVMTEISRQAQAKATPSFFRPRRFRVYPWLRFSTLRRRWAGLFRGRVNRRRIAAAYSASAAAGWAASKDEGTEPVGSRSPTVGGLFTTAVTKVTIGG